MKVYLIFYEINENVIEIISFWDNRQDKIKIKNKNKVENYDLPTYKNNCLLLVYLRQVFKTFQV